MASHSAFKIRIAHEAYRNFFTNIRTGEMPERLAAQWNPGSEIPYEIWNFDSPVHPQLSEQPAGDAVKTDWSVYFHGHRLWREDVR